MDDQTGATTGDKFNVRLCPSTAWEELWSVLGALSDAFILVRGASKFWSSEKSFFLESRAKAVGFVAR